VLRPCPEAHEAALTGTDPLELGELAKVGPGICHPPRHQTRFEPSFLELNANL